MCIGRLNIKTKGMTEANFNKLERRKNLRFISPTHTKQVKTQANRETRRNAKSIIAYELSHY